MCTFWWVVWCQIIHTPGPVWLERHAHALRLMFVKLAHCPEFIFSNSRRRLLTIKGVGDRWGRWGSDDRCLVERDCRCRNEAAFDRGASFEDDLALGQNGALDMRPLCAPAPTSANVVTVAIGIRTRTAAFRFRGLVAVPHPTAGWRAGDSNTPCLTLRV